MEGESKRKTKKCDLRWLKNFMVPNYLGAPSPLTVLPQAVEAYAEQLGTSFLSRLMANPGD